MGNSIDNHRTDFRNKYPNKKIPGSRYTSSTPPPKRPIQRGYEIARNPPSPPPRKLGAQRRIWALIQIRQLPGDLSTLGSQCTVDSILGVPAQRILHRPAKFSFLRALRYLGSVKNPRLSGPGAIRPGATLQGARILPIDILRRPCKIGHFRK